MNENKKLNILHITESSGFSGGVNQALSLAKELNLLNHKSFIATPSSGILYKLAKEQNIEVFDFAPKGSLDFKTILNLKKIIETNDFDIIHAHHSKAHHYSFWVKKISTKKPILVVSRRVAHQIPKNLFALIRYKSKDVNAYIAVCEAVKKILIDYGIKQEKIYVVYSGVDTKKFYPRQKDIEFKKSLGLNYDDFVISLIGNFSDEKGQVYLIKAAKILYDKGYKFKLLFAGMKTDSKEIKELFIKNNIDLSNGVFLGLRHDVEKILNITDISINSSIKEALSGVVRESLACGIPVIAGNLYGNPEILKDGFNGFLFEPGNYMELSQKIEILINNTSLRERFSKNAVLTIRDKFTLDAMVNNTLQIYKKLIKEKL
ncbi:MAG: glycosyltransferase family 4 protein [Elusimicrobiota bacterium]